MDSQNSPVGSNKQHIFLCGGHSVGKTTLMHEILKLRPSLKKITELGRLILNELQITREDLNLIEKRTLYQTKLLETQCIEERKLEDEDYISDRGPDGFVYSSFYGNQELYKQLVQSPHGQETILRYRTSIVFLLKPHEITFKDDSVRMVPDLQDLQKFTTRFEAILQENGIPYTVIDTPSLEERITVVTNRLGRE
jgi:nicotinamide riboside kinase